MNPQKNQGAEDSPLLRDLQAEVSSESAPMLQFMLRHAGTIASIVVLFVLVLAGTGIWRWYSTSKNDEARQSLARIVLQTSGPAQVKELAALAEKAPSDVRFSAYLALGQSAMSNGDNATAADAFGKAAKESEGPLALIAGMNEAGAMLKAGKYADALALLQKLQAALPGEVTAPQLKQMMAAGRSNNPVKISHRYCLFYKRQTCRTWLNSGLTLTTKRSVHCIPAAFLYNKVRGENVWIAVKLED